MASIPGAPAPAPDPESRHYWDGLRRHVLLLQRCGVCRRVRFPPMQTCPYCGQRGHSEIEASGAGRVYSMVRVHRALTPAMAHEVPYTVATVQLDEGPRVIARLDEAAGDTARIDSRVRARYVDHADCTELRFVL